MLRSSCTNLTQYQCIRPRLASQQRMLHRYLIVQPREYIVYIYTNIDTVTSNKGSSLHPLNRRLSWRLHGCLRHWLRRRLLCNWRFDRSFLHCRQLRCRCCGFLCGCCYSSCLLHGAGRLWFGSRWCLGDGGGGGCFLNSAVRGCL